MKFSNPLRRVSRRDEQLATLNSKLAAAAEIPEPGERMLRYGEITRAEPEKQGLRNVVEWLSAAGAFGGFLFLVAGTITIGLPGFLTGVALLASSAFVGITVGADTENGFGELHAKSSEATEKLITNTPLASFARSPKFEAVMERFPKLKEKFVLSAARDRVLEADALSAPQQARKETLSL